jgi:streptogramin lyase
MWFTEYGPTVNQIGRITTTGVISEFPDGSTNSRAWRIVYDPNGTIWYTEFQANKLANVPVCAVGLVASYSSSTSMLSMNFSIGSTEPYTWTTGLYRNGVLFKQLWSNALPAEEPLKTRSVNVSLASGQGPVTVISGLYQSNGTAVCTENAVIQTQ